MVSLYKVLATSEEFRKLEDPSREKQSVKNLSRISFFRPNNVRNFYPYRQTWVSLPCSNSPLASLFGFVGPAHINPQNEGQRKSFRALSLTSSSKCSHADLVHRIRIRASLVKAQKFTCMLTIVEESLLRFSSVPALTPATQHFCTWDRSLISPKLPQQIFQGLLHNV